jgi:hypothetical protein
VDKAERTRLKTLANDAVIATFGSDNRESQLAEALERCVDELEDANSKCPTCSVCENHGDLLDESIKVDPSEILRIHSEFKDTLKALKDYHVKLSGEIADEFPDLLLADDLASLIEEAEGVADELEAEVTP